MKYKWQILKNLNLPFIILKQKEKEDFVTKLAKANSGIDMAVTVLKNISQDEINWYHAPPYWMHVSDEKSMISSAGERGIAKLTNLSIDDVQKNVKENK